MNEDASDHFIESRLREIMEREENSMHEENRTLYRGVLVARKLLSYCNPKEEREALERFRARRLDISARYIKINNQFNKDIPLKSHWAEYMVDGYLNAEFDENLISGNEYRAVIKHAVVCRPCYKTILRRSNQIIEEAVKKHGRDFLR